MLGFIVPLLELLRGEEILHWYILDHVFHTALVLALDICCLSLWNWQMLVPHKAPIPVPQQVTRSLMNPTLNEVALTLCTCDEVIHMLGEIDL